MTATAPPVVDRSGRRRVPHRGGQFGDKSVERVTRGTDDGTQFGEDRGVYPRDGTDYVFRPFAVRLEAVQGRSGRARRCDLRVRVRVGLPQRPQMLREGIDGPLHASPFAYRRTEPGEARRTGHGVAQVTGGRTPPPYATHEAPSVGRS